MYSLYRTLSLRYLQQRGCAALVVASIAIGVATLVATQTLNRTMLSGAGGGFPIGWFGRFARQQQRFGRGRELGE